MIIFNKNTPYFLHLVLSQSAGMWILQSRDQCAYCLVLCFPHSISRSHLC